MEPMTEKQLQDAENFQGSTSFAVNEVRNKKGRVYLTDTNYIIRDFISALNFHLKKRSRATGRVPAASKGRTRDSRVRMREAGALISRTGPKGNVLKIRPPLVFDTQNGELLVETLGGANEERLPRILSKPTPGCSWTRMALASMTSRFSRSSK